MKEVRWSLLKNDRLKRTRGASFEELLQARLVDVRRHPTKADQKMILVEHKGYIWVIPYIETEHERFLKTLYPSRKYTKLYKRGEL